MPPADSQNVIWQWTEIAGIFAVIAGVLIPLCNSLINRKIAERQLGSQENQEARRNLSERIKDLEIRFDLERRECDRKIDELRAVADEERRRWIKQTEEYVQRLEPLRETNINLRQRIYELEGKLHILGEEAKFL